MRALILGLAMVMALQAQDRVPVLVELFTSEGCSSCPPADELLAELQGKQPVKNVDLVVLSEHVDYWNSLGWKDPFSDWLFTQRQQMYARAFHGSDVYTPQAVIDGRFGAVGSRGPDVLKAIADAGKTPKVELAIDVKRDGDSVFVDLPGGEKGVWVAVTQANAVSKVAHGENGGQTLRHVSVVRSLTQVKGGQAKIAIDPKWGSDLGVVVFVQDARSMRILKITQRKI